LFDAGLDKLPEILDAVRPTQFEFFLEPTRQEGDFPTITRLEDGKFINVRHIYPPSRDAGGTPVASLSRRGAARPENKIMKQP
jgi:hypothetical protein